MDALFEPLASALGASVDQIKIISCLLFSYPLGSVFIRLPASQPALKHLFNLAVAAFYLLPVLNLTGGSLQLLGSVLGTYFIAKMNKSERMPWLVFAFTMGHLTINHVLRVIFNWSYETFEVTGPQMVLTMKLTTFAWNVYDGRRPVQDLDKWQLSKRVTKFPSLLEFLGYAFYFPGVLVGPYLEYAAYMSLVDGSLFTDIERTDKAVALKQGSRIPTGRKRVAYRKMLEGLVWLGLFVTFSGQFNFGVALQPWFLTKALWYRIAYFQVCGIFERAKYYALWTLTEGASILTGLGFTGYAANGASQWQGAANVDVPNIELAPNFKVMLDNWNMKTNMWLRECVYKRVTPKGAKPGFRSTMITFGTSAFWHGVAGGYYLAFFFGGFVQTAGRQCRSNLRPLFLNAPPATTKSSDSVTSASNGTAVGTKPTPAAAPTPTALKPLYDIAGTVVSVLILNYAAAPFMILSLRDSLRAWSRLGWYGHVILGVCLVFFWSGGGRLLRAKGAKRGRESAPGTPGVGTMPPVDLSLREVERKLM